MIIRVGPQGLALLDRWEGMRLTMYPDSGGKPTIGRGHCLTKAELTSGKLVLPRGETVKWRHGLTAAQVERLFSQDLQPTERVVRLQAVARTPMPLAQHQYDALVCLTFNIGTEAFTNSTLLKCLRLQDLAGVVTQWRGWVYDGGKVIPGLRNRRAAEIALWEGKA